MAFNPVVLLWIDWPGSEIRVHSNAGAIGWDGYDWTGVGRFGQVAYPGEGVGLPVQRLTLTLFGDADDVLSQAQQNVRNRDAALWFGVTTQPGGNVLIGDPAQIFTGYVDAMRFTFRPEGEKDFRHALQVDLGSGPSARAGASVFHSYERQIQDHPGDTAGRHLIGIEARIGTQQWG